MYDMSQDVLRAFQLKVLRVVSCIFGAADPQVPRQQDAQRGRDKENRRGRELNS